MVKNVHYHNLPLMFYKSIKIVMLLFTARSIAFSGFRSSKLLLSPIRSFVSTSTALHSVSVYIGNLPLNIDEKKLGSIVDENGGGYSQLRVAIDRRTGKSRGFGYVDFEAQENAEKIREYFKQYCLFQNNT